jgi:hypothetical protein
MEAPKSSSVTTTTHTTPSLASQSLANLFLS